MFSTIFDRTGSGCLFYRWRRRDASTLPANARWQKMARIIAKALIEFETSQVYADGHAIAGRIRALAEAEALMVQGNMSYWRRCEVRLLS